MQIELDEEQRQWLEARISAGEYASLDEAVAAAVRLLMLDDQSDEELASAQPLIDEGLAQVEQGSSLSEYEVMARVEAAIADRG